jgi:hypothetical protein
MNRVLTFDAVPEDENVGMLEMTWHYLSYPFNALGGLPPIEVPGSW